MLLVGNSKKGPSAFGSLSKQCQCRQGVEVSLICPTWWGGPTHVIRTCSAPPRPDTNNPSRPRSTLRISAFRPPAVASSSPEFHSRVITPLCHGTAIAASKLERPRNPRPKFKKTPDGKKKPRNPLTTWSDLFGPCAVPGSSSSPHPTHPAVISTANRADAMKGLVSGRRRATSSASESPWDLIQAGFVLSMDTM